LATFAGAIGVICLFIPGPARAGQIYMYSGQAPTSFSITLNTSLSGAALDNLPAGTDISASTISLTFSGPDSPPSQDGAGFPIGGGPGSGYLTETPATIQIGTDSTGQITSWDIELDIFASYPAVPNEDPADFYCTYRASSTTNTDSVSLTLDNDAGFCPNGVSNSASAENWTSVAAAPSTPEPQSFMMLASGICISVLAVRCQAEKGAGAGN
jgi:hypothetical protein